MEPGQARQLFNGYSSIGVDQQHPFYGLVGLRTQTRWDFALASLDFGEEGILLQRKERIWAMKHEVEKYSETPNIRFIRIVGVSGHNFWWHVSWCAAVRVDLFFGLAEYAKTKIDQFYSSTIKKNVLCLDVTMDNSFFLHEDNGVNNLAENKFGFLFIESLIFALL